jgi:hypothetical protein
VYKNTHPAANQYVARKAEIRWPCGSDQDAVLATLYQAHIDAVYDWIPFDRYLPIYSPWTRKSFPRSSEPDSEKMLASRGPGFLIRAYAKALRIKGEPVQVTARGTSKRKSGRPKVLHFGGSHIVADRFVARRASGATALHSEGAGTHGGGRARKRESGL